LWQGKFSEIDAQNIAEELESMAKSDKRQLVNQLIVLIAHLLKWQYQPDHRSSSWQGTIREQRRRIWQLIEDSPSLQHELQKQKS